MKPFKGLVPDSEWFRMVRLENRISQTEIAKRVGVHRSTIVAFESGKSISLENALKYAQAMGFKVNIEVDKNAK